MADAGRTTHLVAGTSVEVATYLADIDWKVRNGLGAINQDPDLSGLRHRRDPLNRIDAACYVGDVRQCEDSHAVIQHRVQRRQI